jgi:hypothetical protein
MSPDHRQQSPSLRKIEDPACVLPGLEWQCRTRSLRQDASGCHIQWVQVDCGCVNDSQTPPVLDDLSEMERAVVDAARWGLGDLGQADSMVGVDELATTEDPGQQVRAVVIRELLMGRRGELDPRGLRVQHGRVVGQLDLDHITSVTSLSLVNCALPDGVTCCHAQLHEVNLTGSSLLSALTADDLRTDGHLLLRKVTMRVASEDGGIRLWGAHVGGRLDLDGSEITNGAGPALHGDSLRTDGTLFMRNATMRGGGETVAVRLVRAHINGQAHFTGTQLSNDSGRLLTLQRLNSQH